MRKLDLFLKSIGLTLILFSVCVTSSVFIVSCKTSQQQTAFNTLCSVEKVTTSAYDGYLDLVIAGKVGTNDLARASKAFNTFQAAMLVALDGVQFNTNAMAPQNVLTESGNVISLITQIKKDIK